MAGLVGYMVRTPRTGAINPHLSADLRQFDPEVFAPRCYIVPRDRGGAQAPRRMARALRRGITGQRIAHAYYDDFYNRIHVRPRRLALGNLPSAQVRQLEVWNAYFAPQELAAVDLVDGAGISIDGPGPMPVAFAPLQARTWSVTIGLSGPPVIDAQIVFDFTGLDGVSVRVTGVRMTAWLLPPDWAGGVEESLEWLTDAQHAITGHRTATPLRSAPRREWQFAVLEGRQERRILENALYDWSARVWALPVWTDIEHLAAPLAAGATHIPADTAGLDFRAGGFGMLWRSAMQYELVEIDQVQSGGLDLVQATSSAWAPGTRLYPARTARLAEAPRLGRKTDRIVVASSVRFRSEEACDWPAISPPAMYLGFPVLEDRPDWGDDREAAFDRQLAVIDGKIGPVEIDDISGLAWQRVGFHWRLFGRAERAALRSLLYWLEGRAQVLWVPSGADDVELVQATGPIADTLTVAFAGIARHLQQQVGRRHLRIQLFDGRVFYRRVTGSEELDSARERLLLSSGLGEAIAPDQVALISWMTLSHQGTDRVQISHMADSRGVADVRSMFVAAGAEEP